MEIFLKGHDYKYAAEQMLLTLYPAERPVYPPTPSGADRVGLSLREGKRFAVVSCRLYRAGRESRGEARVPTARLTGQVERDRLLQRAVKLAFYRAAMAAGHERLPWGALTGVRPVKLLSALLQKESERAALGHFQKEFDVSPRRAALCLDAARASEAARRSLRPEDVCLYIGIPFCPSRCAYCSFVSVEAPKQLSLVPDYLAALEKELEAVAAAVTASGRRVVSVYVGGGTPTTLSAAELHRLLSQVEALFDLTTLRELTVEAGRPDTVTAEKLAVLGRHHVDRVSVNPQTMSDGVLAAIGRRHTVADVYEAVRLVREAGDFALNMDLIAGLPGDTPAGFRASVAAVLALSPENVTVHTLALKKGSRFLTEGADLPDGVRVGEMVDAADALLSEAGYRPYYLYRQKFMSGSFENVGWTRPGQENLYNICIMEELTGVLAAGAGGSTKLVSPGGALRRLMAPKFPKEYMERIGDTCGAKRAITDFYALKGD